MLRLLRCALTSGASRRMYDSTNIIKSHIDEVIKVVRVEGGSCDSVQGVKKNLIFHIHMD